MTSKTTRRIQHAMSKVACAKRLIAEAEAVLKAAMKASQDEQKKDHARMDSQR